MPVLIIFYPLLEFYCLYQSSLAFGFLNVVLYIFASGFIGLFLMFVLGQSAIRSVQGDLIKGQLPGNKILHRGIMFLGALFIFFPGIITDLIGVILLLPGLRHLIVFYFKFMMAKGLFKGNFKFFYMGNSGIVNEREVRPFEPDVIDANFKRIEDKK